MRLSRLWESFPLNVCVVVVAMLAALPAMAQQASQSPQSPQPSEAEKGVIAAIDQMTQNALGDAASAKNMRDKILAWAQEQQQHQQVLQSQVNAESAQNGELSRAKAWFEDCLKYINCWQWLKPPEPPVAQNKQ